MEDSFAKRRDEWVRGQDEWLNGEQLQTPGDIIRPVPWCAHIDSPSDISLDMARNLLDIIQAVKVCHFKGTSQEWRVARSDIHHFLRLVFRDGWQSGDYHELATDASEPDLEEVGVRVGTLRRTSLRPSLDASRASESAAEEGSSATKQPANTASLSRKKSARVRWRSPLTQDRLSSDERAATNNTIWLHPKPGEGMVTFKLYDNDNKQLPSSYGPKDVVGMPKGAALVRIKRELMQKSDDFHIRQTGFHNVNLAVWLARNRVTLWANKRRSPAWRPLRAKGDSKFMDYSLTQNMACPASLQNQKSRLLALPRPDVWSLVSGLAGH